MQNSVIFLLGLSLFFLVAVSIFTHHFLALYYVVWICGFGLFLWKKRTILEEKLAVWANGSFKKFLALGLMMILLEETLAGISMHLASIHSLGELIIGILQFWAFNLLTLPGFIIAWYLLLRRYFYSRSEIFILVGIFGLFAESVISKIIAFPLAGIALILPTMFTYAIIIAPSIMSFRGGEGRPLPRFLRYLFSFIVPIFVSMPFLLVLFYLKSHFPGAFPPSDFVG